MKDDCATTVRRSDRGFSLLEMIVVVAVILIMAGFTLPVLMTQVYANRSWYSATNLSGVLQRARMEAARKNTFYSVQQVAGNPVMEEVVDKNAAVVASIAPAVMGQGVTVSFGAGSGAPGESAFITNLNFTTAAPSTLPSFNARGLPCTPAGVTCPVTPGQGFVFFLSGTSTSSGGVGWTAVAVTPSGRCEAWIYGGTNWVQQ
jgi:prepilin-type N-terminal cleavage/methylation domain-containing protein